MNARKGPLETIRDRHRRWLGQHRLLDRPWFVLGSAPDPTIPGDIAARAALVCINNAGATAAARGLPPASLTVRNRSKEWGSVAGCTLPLVLWMTDRNFLQVQWKKLSISRSQVGEIRTLRSAERQDIYTHMLGSDLADVGHMHKPSTGIFAALYGLFVGAPGIVLGGLSMDKDGYSYGPLPGVQLHREEDRFALRLMAEHYPSVRTTEEEVSDMTGVPLYRAV